MIRLLAKSIREYKRDALLTPVFVTLEVIIECIIPFLTANLVWEIQHGCELSTIIRYGVILMVLAGFSLFFGRIAGTTAASASAGYARNLRRDMFYNIQNFSFANIDRFSTSSLVTRMTTDVTNVQMAFMMIIRGAIRFPLMLVFSFIMAYIMGGSMAFIFLFTIPVLAIGLAIGTSPVCQGVPQVRHPEQLHPGERAGHAGGEELRARGLREREILRGRRGCVPGLHPG